MLINNYPGKLITLEGPEGSGKTTQAGVLSAWLRAEGFEPVLTMEPGGTPLGSLIRKVLLEEDLVVHPRAEIFLYAADRAQHMAEVIIPALKAGRIVLCDRFIDSTSAYQGFARDLGMDLVARVNSLATWGIVPDLTLLFDIPVDVGMHRKRGDFMDRIEQEEISFHEAVREGYLETARLNPERIRVVNASKSIEEVSRQSIDYLSEFLKKSKGDLKCWTQ